MHMVHSSSHAGEKQTCYHTECPGGLWPWSSLQVLVSSSWCCGRRNGGAVVRISEMLCVCVKHVSPPIVCFLLATHMTLAACFHAILQLYHLSESYSCWMFKIKSKFLSYLYSAEGDKLDTCTWLLLSLMHTALKLSYFLTGKKKLGLVFQLRLTVHQTLTKLSSCDIQWCSVHTVKKGHIRCLWC